MLRIGESKSGHLVLLNNIPPAWGSGFPRLRLLWLVIVRGVYYCTGTPQTSGHSSVPATCTGSPLKTSARTWKRTQKFKWLLIVIYIQKVRKYLRTWLNPVKNNTKSNRARFEGRRNLETYPHPYPHVRPAYPSNSRLSFNPELIPFLRNIVRQGNPVLSQHSGRCFVKEN